MEIVLLTENQKYQELIPESKMMTNSIQSIVDLVETQLFLNQHHRICLCFLKENLSYQFQVPIRIAAQLLERANGTPILLIINDKKQIQLSHDSDLGQIFSQIQYYIQSTKKTHQPSQIPSTSLIDSQHLSKSSNNQSVISYCFKFWSIQLELIYAEMSISLSKYEQKILEFIQNRNQKDRIQYKNILKIFIGVNQSNYSSFLNWADLEKSEIHKIFADPRNLLSQQYLKIKQEIDNQKNSFRNRIKLVKAIIGQDINVQKLFTEDQGVQGNSEYKRIKQIFQTIKNIDYVLIEQQNRLKKYTDELKVRKKQKSQKQSSSALQIAHFCKEINALNEELRSLEFKLQVVSRNREKFVVNRSFDVSQQFKTEVLQPEISRMREILRGMKRQPSQSSLTQNTRKIKLDSLNLSNQHTHPHPYPQINPTRLKSLKIPQTKKPSPLKITKAQQNKNFLKKNKHIHDFQNSRQLQNLLSLMYDYYKQTQIISNLINQKIKQNANMRSLLRKNSVIDQYMFPILKDLVGEQKIVEETKSNCNTYKIKYNHLEQNQNFKGHTHKKSHFQISKKLLQPQSNQKICRKSKINKFRSNIKKSSLVLCHEYE